MLPGLYLPTLPHAPHVIYHSYSVAGHGTWSSCAHGSAGSEGYVVNQRDLDENGGLLRLKCAHKTTAEQGGGGVGLRGNLLYVVYIHSNRHLYF